MKKKRIDPVVDGTPFWWPRPWLLLAVATWLLLFLLNNVVERTFSVKGLFMITGALFFTCILCRRLAASWQSQRYYSPFGFFILTGCQLALGGFNVSLFYIEAPAVEWLVSIGGAMAFYGLVLMYMKWRYHRKRESSHEEKVAAGAWMTLSFIYYLVFNWMLAPLLFSPLGFIVLAAALILAAEAGRTFAANTESASLDSCGFALMIVAVLTHVCPVAERQPMAILSPYFPIAIFGVGTGLILLHHGLRVERTTSVESSKGL
ncbi:MAG: hypothetical protein ACAI35_22110 [Candidatus Methylacidiphilales bacterium]|nr:hypothetical protein [Candidatus Methylacidiphilales bacterium]